MIIKKKWDSVLGMIPVPVFIVDKIPFRPKWKGGMVYGPIVFIMDKYADDKGLHKHELWHVKQFWMTLGLHAVLYPLNLFGYKLWSEVVGYRIQWLEYNKKYAPQLAKNIATLYGLNISESRAKRCIFAGKVVD